MLPSLQSILGCFIIPERNPVPFSCHLPNPPHSSFLNQPLIYFISLYISILDISFKGNHIIFYFLCLAICFQDPFMLLYVSSPLLFFIAKRYSIVYIYYILLSHPSVNERLCCFHPLVFINNAINIPVHV